MNKKLLVTVGLLALISFFGYRAYASRPIRFSDNAWGGALTKDPACTDPDTPRGYEFCGLVGFVFNEPHPFKVGDMVDIMQDAGTNAFYNGKTKVVWVDKMSIIVNKGFGESTPAEPGSIRKVL